MPSLQARFLNPIVRFLVKRREWGRDEYELARLARRTFGSPRIARKLAGRLVNISFVDNGVRGEWLRPKTAPRNAAILYIHGGGFVSCSAATHRPISAAIARMSSIPVFAVNYRLAPEDRFPAALDDVHAAYKWLIDQGQNRPIAIVGDSAGGGLTLSLLLRLRDEGGPMPACAVCFSPWTDLTVSGQSGVDNSEKCQMFFRENCVQFARAYVRNEEQALDPLVSPVFAEFNDLPPILLQVGSTEVLVDDSRRIHDKIQAAGGTSELEIYDEVFHCWQMESGSSPRHAARSKAP